MTRKILFVTGTRADYGKMKPLIKSVEECDKFECHIFVTGMHTMAKYGNTKSEIIKDGYKNVHTYMNQIDEEPMDLILANTINGIGRYIRELNPDMIVIHGDRLETLAAAIVGAFNNILVAHVEGGEVSGTIDESIRHSVTKLAHVHFVSNNEAKKRLLQLGEMEESIYVIGSPDIDILLKKPNLTVSQIKKRYQISFNDYSILIFHPVTTEVDRIREYTIELVNATIKSEENYIVIYPNNDTGQAFILEEYEAFRNNPRFKIFPSIRFEFFLEILKNAKYIIGNSSVGIHEAPVLGIPSINIGTRQKDRFTYKSIINCNPTETEILFAIEKAKKIGRTEGTNFFGEGKSKENFIKILLEESIWQIPKQKKFIDRI